jgi:hypothetical protein
VFIGVYQFSEDGVSGIKIVFQAQHRERNFPCIRAGETDHPDAPASGRSGDGDDGVVEVHRKIVAVLFLATRPLGKTPRRRFACGLVILRIDDQATTAAFALALGVQVGVIAQR